MVCDSCPVKTIAVLEIQSGRQGLIDVRDLGIRRPRQMSEVAELLVCGASVGRGPFLVHLDGKICSAKSNRSRHREKGISDFVDKSFRMTISFQLRGPISQSRCTAAEIAQLGTTPLFEVA